MCILFIEEKPPEIGFSVDLFSSGTLRNLLMLELCQGQPVFWHYMRTKAETLYSEEA